MTTNTDYYWLNDDSRTFLSRGYIQGDQTAEERFDEIARQAEKILSAQKVSDTYNGWPGIFDGFAEAFLANLKKGWYSLSSPIISNFGTNRGLPISCNGSYIDDTMDSILGKVAEVGTMTKMGAGTSAYLGALRPRGAAISGGGSSSGPVHFAQLLDTTVCVVSQSNIRRGNCAVYLDVDHPDIEEFLRIRDEGHPIQNLSIGVCIPDEWMRALPKDKAKQKIWATIVRKRFESGYPYIVFTGNANKQAPEWYRAGGYVIRASNLCSEIMEPSKEDESFVCDLASMNLLHWDEWKDTNAVQILTWFLDAVMTDYIQKVEGVKFMEAAYNFAVRHRALGIGGLGWHSLLQSKMIAWESMEAKLLNAQIWRTISAHADAASTELARILGECEVCKGYGQRNATLLAVAPTTSSSFILGQVSPSIEPLNSNYFVKDLAKGKFTYKNPHLREVLKNYGKDTAATWKSIMQHGWSVQHLTFLTQHEKDVFKTFGEISQKEIVIQAAQRQKFIDQSQSLNLMVPPNTPAKEVSELLIFGWEQGLKSFYYQRSANPAQELGRSILNCASCES